MMAAPAVDRSPLMRRNRAALFLAALGLAVAACGAPASTQAGPALPGGAPAVAAPGASAGQLGFTASTVDGASFDASTLAGKPAVLWFWAPF